MIRKCIVAVALVAMVAVAAPAFAGGGGGGGSKSNYTVRVKNNGSEAEAVSVTQGATPSLVGSKVINPNQVAQFSAKKGAFVVANFPTTGGSEVASQAFTAGAAKRIYALAAIDTANSVGTVTGSKSAF